ncbi:MAG: ParB/RepB/Spo0J family partition protein [Syntrophomonadaceae bacterium]|nr:ParB/RepB/Spo0J family partition protein [Syntrophomonadaceae bacterium]
MVAVEHIDPNPYQPRRSFDDAKLEELAASIREHGVVQPIVVRPLGGGRYELVAGERRWRACRLLGMESVPAVVKDLSASQTTELALIENIQREDLSPLEEAGALRTLMQEFGFTQEQLALRLGKSRPYVANILRLLQLPNEIQVLVSQGQLSAGHARALLSIEEPQKMIVIGREIARRGLNVRSTEEMVRKIVNSDKTPRQGRKKTGVFPEADLEALVDELQSFLGAKVRIKVAGEGGRLEIEYYSKDDLSRVIDLILPR